jgi:hypothetical protein
MSRQSTILLVGLTASMILAGVSGCSTAPATAAPTMTLVPPTSTVPLPPPSPSPLPTETPTASPIPQTATATLPPIPTAQARWLFASGLGPSKYAHMTYADYESTVDFTPSVDLYVSGILPFVFYCNGTCNTSFELYDPAGNLLARNDWQGTYDQRWDPIVDVTFDKTVILKAGTTYRIEAHVWTTKSIGISTAGPLSPNVGPLGQYTLVRVTQADRGPISFRIIGSR